MSTEEKSVVAEQPDVGPEKLESLLPKIAAHLQSLTDDATLWVHGDKYNIRTPYSVTYRLASSPPQSKAVAKTLYDKLIEKISTLNDNESNITAYESSSQPGSVRVFVYAHVVAENMKLDYQKELTEEVSSSDNDDTDNDTDNDSLSGSDEAPTSAVTTPIVHQQNLLLHPSPTPSATADAVTDDDAILSTFAEDGSIVKVASKKIEKRERKGCCLVS